jgi:hypothetical protein
MKRKIIITLLVSLICCHILMAELVVINPGEQSAYHLRIIETTADYTTVEYVLNHYRRHHVDIDGKEYLSVFIDSHSKTAEKGDPELPMYAKSIIIPPKSLMKVEVLKSTFTDHPGVLAPSKGVIYRSTNPADIPFTFSQTYTSDAFFPLSPVSLSDPFILREYRGISYQILPVICNPVSETIRIYESIIFRIYPDGDDYRDIIASQPTMITRDFLQIYENKFQNFETIRSTYPALLEQGTILIISHETFMSAMAPYVQWKNQKGIPTEMVSRIDAGSTATAIRNYIIGYYQANPTLAYVQIVGDAPQVPTLTFAGGGSDPSYAMIIGTNNYPDLFVGRFSAETVAHVNTQVERSIFYERDIMPDATWLSRAMGLASNEGGGWSGHNGESDITHMNIIRNRLMTGTYDVVDQIYQGQGTNAANTQAITTNLNAGRGFINFVGHGLEQSWHNPIYTNNHINTNLVNSNRLPFIVSVACQNGNFVSWTCFAEAWLRATHSTTGEPTGAVATFMSSIDQPWNQPMCAQDEISVLLVNEVRQTIGGLFFNGASAMLALNPNSGGIETIRTWNIFGDASLMVRSKAPETMIVSAPPTILLGLPHYTVSAGVADALVSLYNPATQTLIVSDYTDNMGNVTLNIGGAFTGPADVLLTITAFNKVTHIENVSVVPNDGPYILLDSITHPDGTPAVYGTTKVIDVKVKNVGAFAGENLTATLSTQDPYIHITEAVAVIELIASTAYYTIADQFTIEIAPYTPDQHVAEFSLSVTDSDDGVWDMAFSITVNSPVISFVSTIIDDSIHGNNNGGIDPGETVSVMIGFTNTGHASASIGEVLLFSSHPMITILENQAPTAVIGINDVVYATFTVTAHSETPIGTSISFGYLASYSSTKIQSGFYLPIGQMIENFATGDLSAFNWNNTGTSPWIVATENPYQGDYCLASGTISHNQNTAIDLFYTSGTAGTISFMLKVSSEPQNDRLQFFVNDMLRGEWSGEVGWTRVEFPVSAGVNKFTWRYRKNGTISMGADKAWIDMITLPSAGFSNHHSPIIYVDTQSINLSHAPLLEDTSVEFIIRNFGNLEMQGNISVPFGFSVTEKTGDNPQNSVMGPSDLTAYRVAPHSYKTYVLTFHPLLPINYSGNITITSNDPNKPNSMIAVLANVSGISTDDMTSLSTQLFGNYPNPFNPQTTISFSTGATQHVQISVYNVRGQLVRKLTDKTFEQGLHHIIWDGKDSHHRDVASGLYFYRFVTDDVISVNKMLLLK